MNHALRIAVLAALAAAAPAIRAETNVADTDRDTLDEVVVTASRATTATKTDTALVETPQAISVVTAEDIADRGVQTMQEALRYSAGVTAEAYGLDTRSDGSMIRGFFPTQYLDGMNKLIGYSLMPRADVYTLERIEVLRGPSSVLYGQGTTGGIINMVTKRPQFERAAEASLQAGTFDRRQVQFDATGALDDDAQWAGRVVGVYRDSGMQTDHVPDDRKVLAPSLTWKPGERTSVTLLATFQDDRTASSQQFLPVAATLRAPPGRRLRDSTFLGEPDFDKLDAKQTAGTVLVEHGFTDALTLGANLRYVDSSVDFNEIYPDVYSNPEDPFVDADRRIVNRSLYATRSRIVMLTSDNHLRYTFETGPLRHEFLGGIDYLMYRQRSASASGETTPIDVYAPVYGNFTPIDLVADPRLRQTQTGLYAQDQIRWGERTTLVLGARRDRTTSDTAGSPVQEDRATTYRAGVIVEAGAGFSPYVSYAESFLPVVGLDVYDRPFKPQRGKQVEAGVKWQPRVGTLVTLAAFDIAETNRQTNDPDNVLNTTQTGEVTAKGVELEASHTLPGDLRVTAAVSRTKAEVTKSSFAAEIGVQVSDVPKTQASLWAVKTMPLGDTTLRVGAGARYVSSTLSTGVAYSIVTPGYTVADALVSLDVDAWTFAVNATNVFDKSYYAPCRAFGDCFTGNRRTVVGSVGYRF
ncbi:MAG TPA: TonB-dependent siderophore receptor [Tahibacter sp.]|nr:TonB-dependent siderophore receptor [Tahibacter sp.]